MAKKTEYSVVIPVYNSGKGLELLYSRLTETFRRITSGYEIILVDDCSRDDSWRVMERLRSRDKKVKIIRLMRNFGQHNALMCGFNHASGDYVITMDDDLQHPPEEIPKLISRIKEGYDVVYGKYRNKRHSMFKNFGSRTVNKILKRITGNRFDITSFRIIDRKVIEQIIKFNNYNVIIDVFISNIVCNRNIGICLVEHHARKYGRTNYSFKDLFLFASNMILNYTISPLRAATVTGFVISMLSMLSGIVVLIRFFLHKVLVSGWTSLILSIAFLSGLILFVLGIIGEYVGRIFLSISNKPQFVIRDIKK